MSRSRNLSVSLMATGLAITVALSSSSSGWSQQPAQPKAAIPQFPIPDNFAGVAGSAAEVTRIAGLCGPNRNAQDGYAPAPAFAGQTKAPIAKGTQGYAVETVAKIERPWSLAFLPNRKMLVSYRNGGIRLVEANGTVSAPITGVASAGFCV